MGYRGALGIKSAMDTMGNEADKVEVIRQARARENLATFTAAHNAVASSAKNLQSIQAARTRLDQQQQVLDINKKKAEADMEAKALQGQKTKLEIQMMQHGIDQLFKQHQTVLDGNAAQIDQVEHQQVQTGRQAGQVAAHLFESDPNVQAYATGQQQQPTNGPVPGPMGGMIQVGGQEQVDNTPDAIGSLFGDLPEAGSSQPTMTGRGTLGMSKVTGADLNQMKLQRIEKAKNQGIPLTKDEQSFYNKKMGIKDDKPYNRAEVLRLARTMAMDNAKSQDARVRGITKDQMDEFVPKAEEELYGQSKEPGSAQLTDVNEGTAKELGRLEKSGYKPKAAAKDKLGFARGDIKTFAGRPGEYQYLGDGKFKRVK